MNVQTHIENVSPELDAYLKKIPKKNKSTQAIFLESLSKLAFSLYIIKEVELSNELASILSEIPFDNDYDHWTWIEYAICLKSKIEKEKGDNTSSAKEIKKILSTLEIGSELEVSIKKRVFNSMLDGDNIYIDELNDAMENENNISIYNEGLLYIMEMIKIEEINYVIKKNGDSMKKQIEDQISTCSSIVKNIGIEKTMPFKG